MPRGNHYDEEFIDALRNYPRDLAATGEIANEVGCSTNTVHDRLGKLEDDGVVSSRDAPGTTIWFYEGDGGV